MDEGTQKKRSLLGSLLELFGEDDELEQAPAARAGSAPPPATPEAAPAAPQAEVQPAGAVAVEAPAAPNEPATEPNPPAAGAADTAPVPEAGPYAGRTIVEEDGGAAGAPGQQAFVPQEQPSAAEELTFMVEQESAGAAGASDQASAWPDEPLLAPESESQPDQPAEPAPEPVQQSHDSGFGPESLDQIDRRLVAPIVEDRRAALLEVVRTGVDAETAPLVGRLVLDPEVGIRLLAIEALKSAPDSVPHQILAQALQDPTDDVRAAACRLAAARSGPPPVELLRLVGSRRWPVAQQTCLEILPPLIGRNGLDDAALTDLVAGVARIDTPPTNAEDRGFGAIASAVGIGRLVAELGGPDATASGAAWLLLAEGSADALSWVAQQGRPALRVVAGLAEQRLASAHPDHPRDARSGTATDPAADGGAASPAGAGGPAPAWEPPSSSPPAGPGGPPVTRSTGTDVPAPAGLHAPRERQGDTAPRSPRPDHGVLEPAQAGPSAIMAMARALTDPDDGVRTRAQDGLRALDRGMVRGWATGLLATGTDVEAALAARAAQTVRLDGLGAELLRRAAAVAPQHREAFIDAVVSLEPDPEPLAAAVRSTDASKREEALRVLWQAYGIRCLRHVKGFLQDSSGPVRLAALELVGQSGEPSLAQTALQVLSGDSSPAVRAAAVKLLARAGTDDRAQAIKQVLVEPDPDVRATGMEVLLPRSGPGVESMVLQALEDPDERVWSVVLHHVANLAADDDGLLWTVLKRCDELQRAHVLGLVAERDTKTLAWLALRQFDSSDPADRVLAAELAGQAGTGECIYRLIGALRDPVGAVRRIAARAVSSLRYPEAVPALVASLQDPEPAVRIEVVRALGVIDDEEVVPGLISALNDPDVDVQTEVHSILLRWSSRSVAIRLVEALSVADLRAAASELLARMPTASRGPLLEALVERPEDLGEAIGSILADIAGPEAFVEHLTSLDVAERTQAVEALGSMGGEEAVTGLIGVLSDPDPRIRIRALQHLGRLRDPRAFDAVRRSFLRDPVHEVVMAADEAVAKLQQTQEG